MAMMTTTTAAAATRDGEWPNEREKTINERTNKRTNHEIIM